MIHIKYNSKDDFDVKITSLKEMMVLINAISRGLNYCNDPECFFCVIKKDLHKTIIACADYIADKHGDEIELIQDE